MSSPNCAIQSDFCAVSWKLQDMRSELDVRGFTNLLHKQTNNFIPKVCQWYQRNAGAALEAGTLLQLCTKQNGRKVPNSMHKNKRKPNPSA
eukprot:1157358-Pelagomonas_calceolata.AAC.1